MHAYTNIYIHTYIHTYTDIYIHTYIYTHIHTYMNIVFPLCMFTQVSVDRNKLFIPSRRVNSMMYCRNIEPDKTPLSMWYRENFSSRFSEESVTSRSTFLLVTISSDLCSEWSMIYVVSSSSICYSSKDVGIKLIKKY